MVYSPFIYQYTTRLTVYQVFNNKQWENISVFAVRAAEIRFFQKKYQNLSKTVLQKTMKMCRIYEVP